MPEKNNITSTREYTSLSETKGKLILAATVLASGLGFLMNSAVTIALPSIQKALQTDIAGTQWVVSAYTLMLSSLILVSGALGDILGLQKRFLAGILLNIAGSLASGFSPFLGFLIVSRAVQGVGLQ
ncbi:MAG: MFS transporter [Spirochaetia bacterium]